MRWVGDIWCAVRRSCRVRPPRDDRTLLELRRHERTAQLEVQRLRSPRRQNALERLAREARRHGHG